MTTHNASAYKFWTEVFHSPTMMLAPMVDASELAFRLLCRTYGVQITYSPMLHASLFAKDEGYRRLHWDPSSQDRPFVVQFCANNPDPLLQSALLVQNHCDAVDINLGCPQTIAKRGNYGAYLQDDWELISKMIKRLTSGIRIPVSCKIRIFSSLERTIEYAKMLENSGVSFLTVHGRTRDQKGRQTGIADWETIRAVKDAVSIPVVANGNIQYNSDFARCRFATGCDAVMSAEGALYNPSIFSSNEHTACWIIALKYLSFAEKFSTQIPYIRGHIFKLCHYVFLNSDYNHIRDQVAIGHTLQDFINAMKNLEEFYCSRVSHSLLTVNNLPFHVCQPYIRTSQEIKALQDSSEVRKCIANKITIKSNECNVSRKRAKRLLRTSYVNGPKRIYAPCENCQQPSSNDCDFNRCRPCCKIFRLDSTHICNKHVKSKKK